MKTAGKTLKLVAQSKFHRLLPMCSAGSRLEASGVKAVNGSLIVVFDNLPQVAQIQWRDAGRLELGPGGFRGDLLEGPGFEDIAFDAEARRFYLLREAVPNGEKREAEVVELDEGFRFVGRASLAFPFETANKGFEGVTCLRGEDSVRLLALCEGNRCLSGKKGRKPGGGRIHVFDRTGDGWAETALLALPGHLPFKDYSALDIRRDRVAVVSQRSSMVWIGKLKEGSQDWEGPGELHRFPGNRKGKRAYWTVEGVAWLGDRRIAMVSDRKKKRHPKRARRTDQSLHIFDLS